MFQRSRSISKKLFEKLFSKTIKDFSKSEFDFILPRNCAKIIMDLSFERLNRCCLSPVYSGIVFAGFGKDELMPVVINYIIQTATRSNPHAPNRACRWIVSYLAPV